MRLWSMHPKYLDQKGLVALWRESLLAQKVLLNQTKGYKHHPQLQRFREYEEPLLAIAFYLQSVWQEAAQRGYHFQRNKIHFDCSTLTNLIPVTQGQVDYEWEWLCHKLQQRDPAHYEQIRHIQQEEILPHPLFAICPGDIAPWEVLKI